MIEGGSMSEFTHLDHAGQARMVDVGEKPVTLRRARAQGFIRMSPFVLELIHNHQLAKGDPLGVARVSGIMAAKQTSQWIPLCHNIPLDHVAMTFSLASDGIRIEAEVSATARTGVEMEALSAVAAATLTIYDMCKAVDRDMIVGEICLLEKEGGRSGHYIKGK
jgi:cyclic pyranopterin phosphate synthase